MIVGETLSAEAGASSRSVDGLAVGGGATLRSVDGLVVKVGATLRAGKVVLIPGATGLMTGDVLLATGGARTSFFLKPVSVALWTPHLFVAPQAVTE